MKNEGGSFRDTVITLAEFLIEPPLMSEVSLDAWDGTVSLVKELAKNHEAVTGEDRRDPRSRVRDSFARISQETV